MVVKASIGQDSHRFVDCEGGGGAGAERGGGGGRGLGSSGRKLVLGGVVFEGEAPLLGNSDADVVLHALCNAISGATGMNVLGAITDRMCLGDGVTDSSAYVREALKYMAGGVITHVSFAIECARPAIAPRIDEMRENIAKLIGAGAGSVGITATSGEGLTDFGRGLGIQVFCILTAVYD